MAGMMELSPDFKEFFESLSKHNVRYLVVGGYAVAFHGHPRYTKDIDVWIEATPDNAEKLVNALQDFGFTSLGLQTDDFLHAGHTIQLGVPPNRIDLLTSVLALDFEKCFSSKVDAKVAGLTVYFIDLEHLKQNKRAVGRFQDLADLENLA
jgi:hypothetical protein